MRRYTTALLIQAANYQCRPSSLQKEALCNSETMWTRRAERSERKKRGQRKGAKEFLRSSKHRHFGPPLSPAALLARVGLDRTAKDEEATRRRRERKRHERSVWFLRNYSYNAAFSHHPPLLSDVTILALGISTVLLGCACALRERYEALLSCFSVFLLLSPFLPTLLFCITVAIFA